MGKTILIVDDSASVRDVVGSALKGAGYNVLEAVDGKDALNRLSKLDGQKIHLVISDVNMPNMNGITFLREMKKQPEYKFVPVVMLTTEGSQDMKESGKDAGAKGWILKPFQPKQILAAVEKLLM